MSYQVLARKWRPRDFSELVGQSHVVKVLGNGLDEGRIHHAFLFTGTRGVGKTTIARILAKALNCEQGVSSTPCGECQHCVAIDEGRFVDLLEIDAASRTKVDDTREILDNVQYAPTQGRFKVYLIDEVHMLSKHSFNALLKTLEEPPEHVKFVLATTDPQKIPITILSRCLQFNLRRLGTAEIAGQLQHILEAEKLAAEPAALDLIARAADGSMRDGLSLLDQALAGNSRLEEPEVRDMLGSVEQRHVHAILEALATHSPADAIAATGEVFAQARDMGQLLLDLAEALHRMALIQQLPDYRDDSRADWEELVALAARLDPEDLQLWYQIAITGKRDLPLAPSERSGCEMTLLRMFAFQPDASLPTADDSSRSQANSPKEGTSRQAASAIQARPEARAESLSPENWPHILEQLPLSDSFRTVAGLLVVSAWEHPQVQFTAARDDMILISDRFRAALEQAVAQWAGETLAINIRAVDDDDLNTPAALYEQQVAQTQADAETAIETDPFVRSLVEHFDAEIVRDSIRPIDTRSH